MNRLQVILNEIYAIREEYKNKGLLNSQEYINFEDELNKISVANPNK